MRSLATILLLCLTCLSPQAARSMTRETARFGDLNGLVFAPEGPGPHPAVIALHGCAGLNDRSGALGARYADWATRLVAQGFLVLFPDSFGSRGLGSQCRVRVRAARASRERPEDARRALAYLAQRPDVDPRRISLLGWSNGGSTVLSTIRASGRGAPAFASAVAFYPGCTALARRGGWRTPVPLLLLIGGADDWTPAAPCAALIDEARRSGSPVSIQIYEGAYHDFDAPAQPLRLNRGLAFDATGSGQAHSGTDPAARADSIARVTRFLQRR